jgi:hypothetical protein
VRVEVMTNKKRQKADAEGPRKSGDRRRSAGLAGDAREGDALAEATRRVIEDEIRRGDVAPDPDQKGEPGSGV